MATQSASQYCLTFTHSCTQSHTDGGVNHARRQPARQEQSGWGVLLRDTLTLKLTTFWLHPPALPLTHSTSYPLYHRPQHLTLPVYTPGRATATLRRLTLKKPMMATSLLAIRASASVTSVRVVTAGPVRFFSQLTMSSACLPAARQRTTWRDKHKKESKSSEQTFEKITAKS